MIIDGHSHLMLPVLSHLKQMQEANVEKTILFSTTFHPENAKNAAEVDACMQYLDDLLAGKKGSLTDSRTAANQALFETVSFNPSHYIGFGSVPAGLSLNETKAFMQSHILKHHFKGMGEFTFGKGNVASMEPIFLANEDFSNLPIWIHGFHPLEAGDIEQIAALAKHHPQTPVILGHLGGFYWRIALRLAKEIPNLYLDTSAYYSTFVLETIINDIPDKCIFGVDMPFGHLKLAVDAIEMLSHSTYVKEAVFCNTISKILSL